ncbi:MAG: ParA family protein [Planctomycetes bacterium]|nr:ParA family protein [Planctomycetota bacterium]
MRRIALINQKGGVGKTTTTVNLGAALARAGRRVVVIDLDPQANLSLHLDVQLESGEPSTYAVLLGNCAFGAALRDSKTPGLRLLPSNIDLSGAELELANAFGRELILRDAIDTWEKEHREQHGEAPADYVLLDCPPSLGLLSVNGLVAAYETVISVQTEFFALQGMTKLVDVVGLLRRRLNPRLEITGFLPCLYDNRTKLAREVIAELRSYFPGKVFTRAIAKNVKLAEAPSYGKTIFEYASESTGAQDYELVAAEVMAQEAAHAELLARFPATSTSATSTSATSTFRARGAPTHKRTAHTPTSHEQPDHQLCARATESLADSANPPATTLEKPAALAQVELEPRSSVKSPPERANDDELPELPPDAVLLEGAAD